MSKLTEAQANSYIIRAGWETMQNPELRFGQALFNMLPGEVTKDIIGNPDKDFFYDDSPLTVMDKFTKSCVSGRD